MDSVVACLAYSASPKYIIVLEQKNKHTHTQKGFMIKDRLLRPSLVGVSKKTEKKDEKVEENKENLDK